VNVEIIDWKLEGRRYLGVIYEICQYLHPGGYLEGNEYDAISPRPSDETTGSFRINIKTGKWNDFADSSRPGGYDVVSYWKHSRQLGTQAAALRELRDAFGKDRPVDTSATIIDQPVATIIPVPMEAGLPPTGKKSKEPPTYVFRYLNEKSELLFVVCRWDLPNGKKTFRQMSYCQYPDGSTKWDWKGPGVRSLYGLERLANCEEVVLVEGEKKCDRAHFYMDNPSIAWLSILGGADSALKNSFEPLRNRKVTLWPDRDLNGIECMRKVAKRLLELDCQVTIVDHGDIARCGKLSECTGLRMCVSPTEHGAGNPNGDKWDVQNAIDDDRFEPSEIRDILRRAKPADGAPSNDQPAIFELDYRPAKSERYKIPYVYVARHIKDENGDPCPVPENDPKNFEALIKAFGIQCRRNLMDQQAELIFPDTYQFPQLAEVDTRESIRNGLMKTIRMRCGFPEKEFDTWRALTADHNCYHPFVEWIGYEPVHGTAGFEKLVDAIGGPTPREERRFKLLRWMISGLAITYRKRRDPNGGPPRTHGILALVGPQGNGKSTFISSLAPPSMVLDGAHYNAGQKDSLIENTMRFIVEWAEAGNTLSRSSSEEIKAFSSRKSDTYRRPYDSRSMEVPRRTIFAASVNNSEFLKDDENRRWWIIVTDGSLNGFHGLDMRQVWREVLGLYLQGEPWWLTKPETYANADTNLGHSEASSVREMILGSFDWAIQRARVELNASQILAKLVLPITKPNRNEAAQAMRLLELRGLSKGRVKDGTRIWTVPNILLAPTVCDQFTIL
jgi:putative DNA primase/helicase